MTQGGSFRVPFFENFFQRSGVTAQGTSASVVRAAFPA